MTHFFFECCTCKTQFPSHARPCVLILLWGKGTQAHHAKHAVSYRNLLASTSSFTKRSPRRVQGRLRSTIYCAQHLHNIVPTICTILCADDVVSDIKTVWHLGIHGIKDIFFIAFSSPVIAFTRLPWASLQAIASLFIYHSLLFIYFTFFYSYHCYSHHFYNHHFYSHHLYSHHFYSHHFYSHHLYSHHFFLKL